MNLLTPYIELMSQWGKVVVTGLKAVGSRSEAVANTNLRYETPGGRIYYAAQLRTHFSHEDPNWIIPRLRELTKRRERALLLTPSSTETQRKTLLKGNVDYVDLAGNAHLEKRGFLVHIQGKRVTHAAGSRPDNVFRRAGLQVIYVLLAVPDAVIWPYRPLAQKAGVALRTANYVVEGLRAEGFIAGRGKRRQLVRREDLIARWVSAYRMGLRPKLSRGVFRIRPRSRARLLNDLRAYFRSRQLHWALTGGEAAYQLTGHYRGGPVVIFTPEGLAGFESQIKCIPDPDGDLELLRYFCDAIDYSTRGRRLPLASPLLVYADLLADGSERAVEAGDVLRKQLLERPANDY